MLAEQRAFELCRQQRRWTLATILPSVVQGPPPGAPCLPPAKRAALACRRASACWRCGLAWCWTRLQRRKLIVTITAIVTCCRQCEVRGGGLPAQAHGGRLLPLGAQVVRRVRGHR